MDMTEQFLAALENITDPVVITGLKGDVLYVNAAFNKLSGYAIEELAADEALSDKIIFFNDKQEILKRLEGSQNYVTEQNYTSRRGYDIIESAVFIPYKGASGRMENVIKLSEDISEKKNIIDILTRSYEFIEKVMNNIGPLIVADNSGIVILVNQRMVGFSGYQAGEIIGKKIDVFFKDKVFERVDSTFTSVVTTGKSVNNFEAGFVKKNSEKAIVQLGLANIVNTKHEVYIVMTFEDITARKRSESELKKLSIAVEQSPASVVITDINGIIEYVNPKFTRLTGYEFDEVVGKNPRVLKSGSQEKNYYSGMWDAILAGEEWRGEFHNRKKNGEFYWEIASISPIRDQNGVITHLLAVKEDITERKTAEEALRISEDSLRKKNDAMLKELNYAQLIIKQILPERAPESRLVKIDYRYMPLEAIGGDYFSFFSMGENDTGIFLGDVAGHGVSAALFLSLVKSASDRIYLSHSKKPSAYLKELNKELSTTMVSHFMTALYGFFTSGTQGLEFIFSRGGHPPPVFYSAAAGRSELIMSSGKPIGLFQNIEFEEKKISLSKGDRIFLYTDGLPEMLKPDMNLLGFDGLMGIIESTYNADLTLNMDSILKSADEQRGNKPIEDDIILIGIEAL